MNSAKISNLTAAAALILSASLCIAWIAEWLFTGEMWAVRAAWLLVGLFLTVGTALLLRTIRSREQRAVQNYFSSLCRQNDRDYIDSPVPYFATPWNRTAERVRKTILELHSRIEELEHARSAAEVRASRATDSKSRIENIIAAIGDPILAINDYDELVLANQSAEELFDFQRSKSATKALAQLVRCEKLVELLASTRQRTTSTRRSDELEFTDAKGVAHHYRATVMKMAEASEGEQSGGAVAVLRDISDHNALQKRNAEFVSSVSHEMKTPLAGIKAYVELLADGEAEDDETREEFLGVINGQADRLQRLVENMLNIARIEAGVVNVSKQPRSLNEVLEEAYRVVQPSAETKGITLEQQLSPMFMGVLADRDMLLQAAINLLSNAVKYTSPGGTVVLRSKLADDLARFEVQDSGVGLSEEDCGRVFDKFYRVSKDKQMASGTGLGLPLAKHIVEDVHGGDIAVESVLGQGSTFIVTLPCAKDMRGEG